MKRFIKLFPYIFAFVAISTSCIDNEPEIEYFPNENIAFKYAVKGNYELDYLVGSGIMFKNTSAVTGAATWNFGDNTPTQSGDSILHVYQVAGTYTVELTIAGQTGSIRKKILISDIFPTIKLDPIAGGLCEVKKTPVHFKVEIPNPQNLSLVYKWIFPEGTIDANGNVITESGLADPGMLKFTSIGSQKVRLQTTLGGRALEESYVNVQVGYTSTAKTLYYAVKGGNIMALKLISGLPADIKNSPFDLGVKSGQHAFNIFFNDTSLYVLDAGKQFNYINDVDGNLGDGKISVVSKDGAIVETMLTNVGGTAFNDPFWGYIEPTEKTLYFSDRNTGIAKIALDKRNQTLNRTEYPYWVQNDRLGYYNNGWAFGAMNTNFAKVNGTWWWGKTYSGMGVFRFVESDISSVAITAGTRPAAGILFPDIYIKSFVVDAARGFVYFTVRDDAAAGFYKIALADVESIKTFDDLKVAGRLILSLAPDTEGSAGEYVYITQLTLDPEDGSVYFGYRTGDATKVLSGLKRYNLTSNKVESVIDNVEIYGVTINNKKSKLF
jgi:PKD repeat protein